MAAVGVDGDAQARSELAEVRVRHDVREHAAPLVHLGAPCSLEGFGKLLRASGLHCAPDCVQRPCEASFEMGCQGAAAAWHCQVSQHPHTLH